MLQQQLCHKLDFLKSDGVHSLSDQLTNSNTQFLFFSLMFDRFLILRKEIIWQLKTNPKKLQDDVNNPLGLYDGQDLEAILDCEKKVFKVLIFFKR